MAERNAPVFGALADRLDVESREHAAKRVMRRDPMRQFDVLSEPVEPGLGEPLGIGPTLRSTAGSGQSHKDHLRQIVIEPAIDSRVRRLFKLPLSNFRRSTQAAVLRVETPG